MSEKKEGVTYKIPIRIGKRVCNKASQNETENFDFTRPEFFEWIWSRWGSQGLIGVHEGTLLSEEAAERGFSTDSWVVDSGEAPRERDWIAELDEETAELFFSTDDEANLAIQDLQRMDGIEVGAIERQEPQDWDAEWKKSFLNAGEGVLVPPFWRIVPPYFAPSEASEKAQERIIRINPGAGFGTGTHETTQLCLEAIGQNFSQFKTALDFGSGSGILSVALALLGARVDGVELDPLAIENACENAKLNHVEDKIRYFHDLEALDLENQGTQTYPCVVANILRPVLLEFAPELCRRLSPKGTLILSGLIEKDVASVLEKYSELLPGAQSQVIEKAEWRAIVFKC